MLIPIDLPGVGLQLENLIFEPQQVVLVVSSTQAACACPLCGEGAVRVQSRYSRTLADLPLHGTPAQVRLQARRFFCDESDCSRCIFTERLPQLVKPHARKTRRMQEALDAVGFALGGEAGARLARRLSLPTSPDTLLRSVRAAALAPPTRPPRVLGVDDWALRRGQRYGTILVDLERRRPVDLLPDREADTLAAWLAARPGVEIISRDRAQAYADGARRGAPEAIQVADRFHLVKNLAEALERLLARNHETLRASAKAVAADADAAKCLAEEGRPSRPAVPVPEQSAPVEAAVPQEAIHSPEPSSTKLQRQQAARRERRLDLYTEIVKLRQDGLGKKKIARALGTSPATVRRFLRAGSFPERHRPIRHNTLERHLPYLERRWQEGCTNSAQLWRELRDEHGFRGSQGLVRRYLGQWREPRVASRTPRSEGAEPSRAQRRSAPPSPLPPLSPRRASWLLLRKLEELDAEESALRIKVLELCPEAQRAAELAKSFRNLFRVGDAEALQGWLDAARDSSIEEMSSFAVGLERDQAAVEAAISLPWSNGQVEGQVNRLKLLKRHMYGRAGFDLLRARVLRAG